MADSQELAAFHDYPASTSMWTLCPAAASPIPSELHAQGTQQDGHPASDKAVVALSGQPQRGELAALASWNAISGPTLHLHPVLVGQLSMSKEHSCKSAEQVPDSLACTLDLAEQKALLLSALESLYHDRITPNARHLTKRIAKQSAWQPSVAELKGLALQMEDDVQLLESSRLPCHAKFQFRLSDARIPSGFKSFVYPAPAADPYHDLWWESFARDVHRLFEEGRLTFSPGDNFFQFAESLGALLPLLRQHRLGEVMQVVELAIRRKILAYNGTVLGPLHGSLWQREGPFKLPSVKLPDSCFVNDIAEFKQILLFLFRNSSRRQTHIPLRRLRELVRKSFGKKLNTARLGYKRLTDLMEDSKLSCTFQLAAVGHGNYDVRQVREIRI